MEAFSVESNYLLSVHLTETVVFLRTLASYKIPAVIERRRKELLDKLCLLQGDTLKEAPPVIEPPEEKPPIEEKVTLREKTGKERSTSESSTKDRQERDESPAGTITSPSHGGRLVKRDSKVVNSLVKDYEAIHFSAKKEEEDQTPKRLVTLKKVAKPVDYRRTSVSPPPEEEKEEKKDDQVEEKVEEGKDKAAEKEEKTGKTGKEEAKGDTTDSPTHDMDSLEVRPSRERAPSLTGTDDGLDEGEEPEKGGDKKKKKSKLQFGFKGKKKRDKSPAPERKDKSPAPERKAEPAAEVDAEQPKEEEEEEVQLADGVKICGVLERNKKKGIGHKKVKIDAKVFHTALILGGKEELDLANCSLEETASGFDLTHPQHRSALVFKVDGPEDEKQRWVAVMKETIAEATPAKEEEGKIWGEGVSIREGA